MKTIYYTLIALLSLPAYGQIQQDINKTTGTVSNAISDIDSIRFNGSATEMEVVLNNANVESHTISDIDNVTFSKPLDVINPATNKTWLDRNLGASQAATSINDSDAFGDLYQWGRASDGHESRTSDTTSNLSNSDTPGNTDFIVTNTNTNDWRSSQNDNLWQGVNGTNNPCPAGYRLPTEAEWVAEFTSWSSNDAAGAFASPLKLPMAGGRRYDSGDVLDLGTYGLYWSSTVSTTFSRSLVFTNSIADMNSDSRAYGRSVRCIKD